MAFESPPKPAKLRGMNASMTINTYEWTTDGYGAAIQELAGTASVVPCQFRVLSGSESVRYGHTVNDALYRILCPVLHQNGQNIVMSHDQEVTIGGADYKLVGGGVPQGNSGKQVVIARKVEM